MGSLEPTPVTWVLLLIGWYILVVMLGAQSVMAFRPESEAARRIIIGRGEEWRDRTHYNSAFGIAVADLVMWLPILLVGSVGVVMGEPWGYGLWLASGVIAAYASVLLWVLERAYVYPAVGPLAYYTYIWGIFLYWGMAVTGYSVLRLASA